MALVYRYTIEVRPGKFLATDENVQAVKDRLFLALQKSDLSDETRTALAKEGIDIKAVRIKGLRK